MVVVIIVARARQGREQLVLQALQAGGDGVVQDRLMMYHYYYYDTIIVYCDC